MNDFSGYAIDNSSEASGFYPVATDRYNNAGSYNDMGYISGQPDYNTENDDYSDVSVNVSSVSPDTSEYMKYEIQNFQNRHIRPDLRCSKESYTHDIFKGAMDSSIFNSCEYPVSNTKYTDDGMDESQFDQTVSKGATMIEGEEEELRYLLDLVQQDILESEYDGYYSRATHNDGVNTEQTAESSEHAFLWDYLYEDECLTEERLFQRPYDGEYQNQERILQNDVMSKWNLYPNNSRLRDRCKKTPLLSSSEKHSNLFLHQIMQNSVQDSKKGKKMQKISPKCAKRKDESEHQLCDGAFNSEDEQKIFLGGLPIGLTERTLRLELAAQGYKVLKRPKILRGFAPEVCLRTAEQAKELVMRGMIFINGVEVEVRPYNSLTKISKLKKIPNVARRSVFLGGLKSGTTGKDIQDVLSMMGMKVLNYPVIKNGFSRQVIFENISHAIKLVKIKTIWLNGTFVDVRPFVNQLGRKRL